MMDFCVVITNGRGIALKRSPILTEREAYHRAVEFNRKQDTTVNALEAHVSPYEEVRDITVGVF